MWINNKHVIGIIVLVLLVAGVAYWHFFPEDAEPVSREQTAPTDITITESTHDETDTLVAASPEPAFVPEGWKIYQINEVHETLGGIALAYPPHWEIETVYHPGGSSVVYALVFKGDGYSFRFHLAGTELPSGMEMIEPPYVIDGITSKTWQRQIDDHYEQLIVAGDFQFRVDTPGLSTKLSDTLLSTIRFAK